MIGFLVLGAVLTFLLIGAACFWSYEAGKLAARKAIAQGKEDHTIAGSLKAYVLAMVALLASIALLATILNRVL